MRRGFVYVVSRFNRFGVGRAVTGVRPSGFCRAANPPLHPICPEGRGWSGGPAVPNIHGAGLEGLRVKQGRGSRSGVNTALPQRAQVAQQQVPLGLAEAPGLRQSAPMSDVRAQYEAFPYPERDPQDERKRLVTGSPSDPRELDHYLFRGHRDWTRPLRVLVAGGGTGDGLIQLAQLLTSAGRPYDITYVDLSDASRAVAEARAKIRGLGGITFQTGSLLDAAALGRFDYIDCCGVLHHLPDPAAGFAALRAALAPGGGLGFMVYAPYGRSGVYPLQEAFGAVLAGLPPEEQLAAAREMFARIPEGHPFKRNPQLGDHLQSDAGFFDLLLHSQDRAFAVPDLLEVLGATGWALSGLRHSACYDLRRFGSVPQGMDRAGQMAAAEKLSGAIKVHVGYAVAVGSGKCRADPKDHSCVPHLIGVPAGKLAQAVAKGRALPVTAGGDRATLTLPAAAAPLIAGVNGRRSLADIAKGARMAAPAFRRLWAQVDAALEPWGVLLYSDLLRKA